MGDLVGQRPSWEGTVLLYGARRSRGPERGALSIFRNRCITAHRLFESEAGRAAGGGASGFQSREAQKIAQPGHESDHRGSACSFSLAPSTALRHGQEYRLPAAAQRANLCLEYESEQVKPACRLRTGKSL